MDDPTATRGQNGTPVRDRSRTVNLHVPNNLAPVMAAENDAMHVTGHGDDTGGDGEGPGEGPGEARGRALDEAFSNVLDSLQHITEGMVRTMMDEHQTVVAAPELLSPFQLLDGHRSRFEFDDQGIVVAALATGFEVYKERIAELEGGDPVSDDDDSTCGHFQASCIDGFDEFVKLHLMYIVYPDPDE